MPEEVASVAGKVNPRIRIGRKQPGKQGRNLHGNSVEEGTNPAIIAQRQRFLLHVRPLAKNVGRKKNTLSTVMKEALNHTVIIDGKQSDLTVAEVIVQQRINEAMQPALTPFDVAIKSTELIFDRTEGRPKSINEVSGPDGGPIEKVEVSAVLAKLFS